MSKGFKQLEETDDRAAHAKKGPLGKKGERNFEYTEIPIFDYI